MNTSLNKRGQYPGTLIMRRKRLHFFLCENSVNRLFLHSYKQSYQVKAWAEKYSVFYEIVYPRSLDLISLFMFAHQSGMWERSIPSGQSKLYFTLFQLYFTLSYSQSQRKKNYYSYISPLSGVPPCSFQIFSTLTMQYEIFNN